MSSTLDCPTTAAGHGTCRFCGEPRVLALAEAWGHEFQLDTCCPALHEAVCHEMGSDPGRALEIMDEMEAGGLLGGSLRRVADDGGQLLADWNLEVGSISQSCAKEFVREHHHHCPPPAGDRFRAAIWNGPTLLGVVMVGRPVARALPQYEWAEVSRLCVRRDVPGVLRWNACSQLYGWAARAAAARGMARIITYTLETEEATTLRAAGWTCDGLVGRHGKSWNSASRRRTDKTPTVPKHRWSRVLRPSRRAVQAREAEDQARIARKALRQ